MIWDRTPYQKRARCCFLNFEYWRTGNMTIERQFLIREFKWLMFILIYLREGAPLSNGTLLTYFRRLSVTARYCEAKSIKLQDYLSDPHLVLESLRTEKANSKVILALIAQLGKIGPEITGINTSGKKSLQELKKIRDTFNARQKQHPPIPTRIYSELLSILCNDLKNFELVSDSILDLFVQCTKDPMMGRTIEIQKARRIKLGRRSEVLRPTFPELLKQFGIDHLWAERQYTPSIYGLSACLTDTLSAATLQVMAFTGMRQNEVLGLPISCLKKIKRNEHTHYIIKGTVTKLTQGIRHTQWVTSESGCAAIRIAQRIALTIYGLRGEAPNDSTENNSSYLLFISPEYASSIEKNQAIDHLKQTCIWRRLQFIIQEADICELEQIDPHRSWRSESKFKLGEHWHLTTHQLRRSLALYAQRSGLVSLPSLKRQLQHITQEMSEYYARGSSFAKDFININSQEKHFGKEWQEAQPVSQFLAYVAHVLLADEADLFGVHPHWISTRLRTHDNTIKFDRQATLRRFKKGEIAYKETLLGGCVKVGECDKNPLDILHLECVTNHCKNMVGSKKKLERIIISQEKFVKTLERNDMTSPEFRHEKKILDILKATFEYISKDDI
jgi:integrase